MESRADRVEAKKGRRDIPHSTKPIGWASLCTVQRARRESGRVGQGLCWLAGDTQGVGENSCEQGQKAPFLGDRTAGSIQGSLTTSSMQQIQSLQSRPLLLLLSHTQEMPVGRQGLPLPHTHPEIPAPQ